MYLNGEFETVTLVGSTKYPEVWIEKQRELTLRGKIVHTVGVFGHKENIDMSGPTKRMLDKLHLQKIQNSDSIYVLNINGYIGLGACDEILYARALGKRIYWLEELSPKELACLENIQ